MIGYKGHLVIHRYNETGNTVQLEIILAGTQMLVDEVQG
jgi:hypothetical protein